MLSESWIKAPKIILGPWQTFSMTLISLESLNFIHLLIWEWANMPRGCMNSYINYAWSYYPGVNTSIGAYI